jgi:hypothetical protein
MKHRLFSRCFYTGLQAHSKNYSGMVVPYDETEEVAKLLPMHPQKMFPKLPEKMTEKHEI